MRAFVGQTSLVKAVFGFKGDLSWPTYSCLKIFKVLIFMMRTWSTREPSKTEFHGTLRVVNNVMQRSASCFAYRDHCIHQWWFNLCTILRATGRRIGSEKRQKMALTVSQVRTAWLWSLLLALKTALRRFSSAKHASMVADCAGKLSMFSCGAYIHHV